MINDLCHNEKCLQRDFTDFYQEILKWVSIVMRVCKFRTGLNSNSYAALLNIVWFCRGSKELSTIFVQYEGCVENMHTAFAQNSHNTFMYYHLYWFRLTHWYRSTDCSKKGLFEEHIVPCEIYD